MREKSKTVSRKKVPVVVTGGAGFIGSNLSAELVRRGFKVHIIDDLSWGKKELLPLEAMFHKADIRDFRAVTNIFGMVRPEHVYHLAAHSRVRTSIQDPMDSFSRNVVGTTNVLEAARNSGVKRVVFTSSSAVYGSPKEAPFREETGVVPESPYGVHKYLGEMKCRLYADLYGLPTVVARCFNVYGLNQPPEGANAVVIPIFLHKRKKGLPLPIFGSGGDSRDFIHVDDLVEGIIKLMEHPKLGRAEVINLGSGVPVSVKKIAEMIGGPVRYERAQGEQPMTWANIEKAKKVLRWEPKRRLEDEIENYKREWGIER